MKSTKDLSSELILSEERYRRLFETAQDGILLLDAKTGLIIDANPFISILTGYTEKELFGKHIWDLGFLKNIAANKAKFLELQKKGYARYENLPIETKSGGLNHVEFISNSYLVGDNKIIQCNIRDISNRVKIERFNNELNMMYKIILLCNQVLLHETTVTALIEQMCKILISTGGFLACWVSHAVCESESLIKPIAAEGIDKDYFIKLNKAIESNVNQGLVATAIRLNKLFICQDLENEEQDSNEREYVHNKGYASVAVIPIQSLKKIPYVLVVYGQNPQDLSEDIIVLLKNLAGDIAFGIDNLDAQAAHLSLIEQVEHSLNNTIVAIASMVEQRDPYTAGHQRRVADLAEAIATDMGLSPGQVKGIRMAAVVHDIGKIHVPAEILSKPTTLSEAEFEIIKTHPTAGWEVLKNIDFPWPVAEIVYQHHERLDGSGYPRGLKGDDILLEARIVMVADVVDAMSEFRPYRPALGILPALQEIMKQRGILFDEHVVNTCLKLFLEKNYQIR